MAVAIMAVLAMDVDTIPARAMVTGRGMATAAVREDLREAAIEEATAAAFGATAAVDSTAAAVVAADFREAARVAVADMVGTTKAFIT
jgi:hypothetical protein